MASKPIPRRRADGSVVYRLPFRPIPGGKVTSETFDTYDDAVRFGKLVDRVGGQAARDIRTASTTSAMDIPTLRTLLDDVLRDIDAARSRGTAPEYRRMAERTWLPALGDHPVDSITRDAVVRWVGWQREQETDRSKAARARAIAAQRKDPSVVVPEPRTYSPKSIRNAQSLLSQVLEAARDKGWVSTNVARAVPLPTDHEHVEMTVLSENEFVLLHAAIAPWYQPLVALLFTTGLRFGEATALAPGDLDLDAATPTLRVSRAWKKDAVGSRGYIGSPKSRRARRTVALPQQIVPVLRELAAGKPADALLFTTPRGTQITQPHFHERVWTPALDLAAQGDPPMTKRPNIHGMRHSHASLMIARGMDLLTLQRRLGHESLRTTGDTYGHMMPDALSSAAVLASASVSGVFGEIEA